MLPGTCQGTASLSWANQSNPSLLEGILLGKPSFVNVPPGSGNENNAGFLEGSQDNEAIPSSLTPQANVSAVLPQSILSMLYGRPCKVPPTNRGMFMMGTPGITSWPEKTYPPGPLYM